MKENYGVVIFYSTSSAIRAESLIEKTIENNIAIKLVYKRLFYGLLCDIYSKEENWGKVLLASDIVLRFKIYFICLWIVKGLGFIGLKRFSDTVKADFGIIWYIRGVAELHLGNISEAKKSAQKAFSLGIEEGKKLLQRCGLDKESTESNK